MPDSIAETEPLDAIIVGAGPCGLAVAVAVKERGLRYAILDRGCITESLTRYPSYMTFFSTAELLEIGGVPFTIPEPKPTRRDALAYYRKVVSHHGIDVRQYEEVTAIHREAGAFTLNTRTRDGRERRIASRAVVIATGGFGEPNRLEFEGDGPRNRVVHYYREPYPFFDQDVIVVGGGNSAVEAALDMYRNGVRVRMVHFADTLDRGVKPWVRPDIENRIAAGEIPMHWNSRVAGLGLDETRVRLISSRKVDDPLGVIEASGAFGEFRFECLAKASPSNPKTSAITADSLLQCARLGIGIPAFGA